MLGRVGEITRPWGMPLWGPEIRPEGIRCRNVYGFQNFGAACFLRAVTSPDSAPSALSHAVSLRTPRGSSRVLKSYGAAFETRTGNRDQNEHGWLHPVWGHDHPNCRRWAYLNAPLRRRSAGMGWLKYLTRLRPDTAPSRAVSDFLSVADRGVGGVLPVQFCRLRR